MKNLFWTFVIMTFVFGIAKGQEASVIDDASKVDLDLKVKTPLEFKGTKNSNIDFEHLNTKDFLSFKNWKELTDERALYPEWENIIRERNHKEIAGHFFQCVGHCRIDQADSFSNAQFRSNIYEGDEVSTDDNSYAWIFLLDGTIVRLSPNSSITFNEFNIGIEENFLMARINSGDVLWISRRENTYQESNKVETDQLFFPLSLYDAMPVRDEKKYNENEIFSYLEAPRTVVNQYQRLNEIMNQHKAFTHGKKTYAFLILPNITLMGYAPQVEMISLLGGKSYIKARTNDEMEYVEKESIELNYQLRGFENKELKVLEEGKWFEVDERGRNINEDQNPSLRVVGEFLTKRIPSILVARELMMDQYSKISFEEKYDRLSLAKNYGYRLWGKLNADGDKKDDLYLRLEFLKEYYRRAETTNLLVSERFRNRLTSRGDTAKTMEYGNYFFIRGIDKYFEYRENSEENLNKEELNSTTKKLWKIMHGLK